MLDLQCIEKAIDLVDGVRFSERVVSDDHGICIA